MSFYDKLVYANRNFQEARISKTSIEWKFEICRQLFDAKDKADCNKHDPFLQICAWPDQCIEMIGKIRDKVLLESSVKKKGLKNPNMAPSSLATVAEVEHSNKVTSCNLP